MTQTPVLVLATIFFGLSILFYYHPKQVGAADQNMSNSTIDPKQANLTFFWIDPFGNCDHDFKCTSNLQVSTKINKNNTWSSISGKEINVKPNENYDFITHMKLNEFATESHIKLEGYNQTSNKWSSLKTQCPAGTKGPLEWQEFSCNITIPNDITKIRPILNAGWSSQPGKEAVTLFDDITLKKKYPNRPSYENNTNQKISNSTKIESQTQTPLLTILLDPSILANVKHAIKNNDNNTILQDSLKQLLLQANSFITKKPTSVVEKSQLPPSGDKHDYFSLSPYDWPDPSKPNGLPYIGRDGMVNPEVYSISDKQNLNDMIFWVRTLSISYYLTDDPKYASKAAEFLRVWFLNDNTSMNPNLQYSEIIRGKDTLLHPGIMDGYRLPDVIDSIRLIQHSPAWTSQDQQKIETWFNRYLDWLLNSEAGRKESEALNNHGTGYNIQVSSIATFLNKTDIAKQILQRTADNLIVAQIQEDGRQPLELKRTNAWSYSIFNLASLFKLASIGQNLGVDLWSYKSPHGAGLQKALDYLLSYTDPIKARKWPYQQITPIKPTSFAHLLCQAIIHYPKSSQSYLAIYKSLESPNYISTNLD